MKNLILFTFLFCFSFLINKVNAQSPVLADHHIFHIPGAAIYLYGSNSPEDDKVDFYFQASHATGISTVPLSWGDVTINSYSDSSIFEWYN